MPKWPLHPARAIRKPLRKQRNNLLYSRRCYFSQNPGTHAIFFPWRHIFVLFPGCPRAGRRLYLAFYMWLFGRVREGTSLGSPAAYRRVWAAQETLPGGCWHFAENHCYPGTVPNHAFCAVLAEFVAITTYFWTDYVPPSLLISDEFRGIPVWSKIVYNLLFSFKLFR